MSEAKSENDYSNKTYFEILRQSQKFERQNISMSRPPLKLTPIGTNMSNVTTSHLDLTHIGKKTPDPKPLTQPIDLSKHKGKLHVPEDPDSDTSFSDSSLRESDFSNDSKYNKYKSKGYYKRKNCWKRTKQDSSESSLRNSD